MMNQEDRDPRESNVEVGTQARTAREARLFHAEQKGGKLGGRQQQRSIKEFLSKLKDNKNSTEVPQKL